VSRKEPLLFSTTSIQVMCVHTHTHTRRVEPSSRAWEMESKELKNHFFFFFLFYIATPNRSLLHSHPLLVLE
jgi:hypothetical protein